MTDKWILDFLQMLLTDIDIQTNKDSVLRSFPLWLSSKYAPEIVSKLTPTPLPLDSQDQPQPKHKNTTISANLTPSYTRKGEIIKQKPRNFYKHKKYVYPKL